MDPWFLQVSTQDEQESNGNNIWLALKAEDGKEGKSDKDAMLSNILY